MATGILVSYAGYPYTLSSLFPDNGLASLASVLREQGDDCVILDLNTADTMDRMVDNGCREQLTSIAHQLGNVSLEQDTTARLLEVERRIDARSATVAADFADVLIRRCRAHDVDFVGFKLWNGDGFRASIDIARRLREGLPELRLFAGGPAVHYDAAVVARESLGVFDAIVGGDGEAAMVALAQHVEGKCRIEDVPNVVGQGQGREPDVVDISKLPIPIYDPDVYPSIASGDKLRMFCIDESRGCPMRCAFCINWRIEGSRWRMRQASQVVDEIRGMVKNHHSCAFRLAGTYSPPALVRDICNGIIEQRIPVRFGLFLHPRAVKESLVKLLKQAGCFGVFVGVESGSDTILEKAIDKHVKAEEIRKVLTLAMDHGLFTAASFIFPAPFETPDTEAQTRRFILDVFRGRPNAAVNTCFAGLLPRTTWWNERARFGFKLDVDEEEYCRQILHYKIRHLIPSSLWKPLPYRLDLRTQTDLARMSDNFQTWLQEEGIPHNLPDHDAQVGAALGYGPVAFQSLLRRVFFTGDANGLQQLVDRANQQFEPGADD